MAIKELSFLQALVGERQSEYQESERRLRYPIIGVVGPLGSGKTTVAELLEINWNVPSFPVKRFEEQYPQNPYLESFYDNPRKYAYPNEIFFLEYHRGSLTLSKTEVFGRRKNC